MNGIVKNSMPFASPASRTAGMFGWLSFCRIRISRRNRSSSPGLSDVIEPFMRLTITLTAMRWLLSVRRAAYTRDMPPRPISPSTVTPLPKRISIVAARLSNGTGEDIEPGKTERDAREVGLIMGSSFERANRAWTQPHQVGRLDAQTATP